MLKKITSTGDYYFQQNFGNHIETIEITLAFDPKERKIEIHPLLKKVLTENQKATTAFEKLSLSRKK